MQLAIPLGSWRYAGALIAISVLQPGCGAKMVSFDGGTACLACATRCQGDRLQICRSSAGGQLVWEEDTSCSGGCEVKEGQAQCLSPATCQDGVKNQTESDIDCGGGVCQPCPQGSACGADVDCRSAACSNKVCQLCKAGTGSCLGNLVRTCAADQSSWTTVATCDPITGTVCNATAQKCEPVTVTGSATPTGTYYLFSMFKTGSSAFKGGADVDSYVVGVGDSQENLIYVNRATQLDVYKVELLDSDGDGKLEPNQHPDNPDARGPMEERKLTFLKTYSNVKLGSQSMGELYATHDRVYFLRPDSSTGTTDINEFIFATGVTNLVVKGMPKLPLVVLAFDERSKTWYGAYQNQLRRVYGYHADGGWAIEFQYPNLAGTHTDGLEVVVDVTTNTSYLYVSDMTSDFIAQYHQDPSTGTWTQKNLFKYMETANQAVEGMGFGAFHHFWITSNQGSLYEVGGGDLQNYVGPD